MRFPELKRMAITCKKIVRNKITLQIIYIYIYMHETNNSLFLNELVDKSP